nr:hypothetical protein CFP56_71884 [Quercus suber]
MSTTTSTRTFTSRCHQFAAKPTIAHTGANTSNKATPTVAPTTKKRTKFFPPTKLNTMPRTKPARTSSKQSPTLIKALSSELGDADLGLTNRHKSGRPMRKRVRQAHPGESPFVDSALASDESDLELTSDDEGQLMPRNRKRKRSVSPLVASFHDSLLSSGSEPENFQSSGQIGGGLQKVTQINISNLSINVPAGHVGPVTLQINPASYTAFAGPNGQIPTFHPVTETPKRIETPPVVPIPEKRVGFLSLVSLSRFFQRSTIETRNLLLLVFGSPDLMSSRRPLANILQPAEIRNEIYRLTFVKEDRLNFGTPKGFSRSAALLRTCKRVHDEGTSILYGENKFYFCRRTSRYGSFWEDDWRELGFRSVHAFVKAIGRVNLGRLRHVSFQFEDATPCLNPDSMTHEERRFVNDDILMSILRQLGDHTQLQHFDMNFHGRRRVERSDSRFLDYLQHIRADVVQFVTYPINLQTTWAMESKQDEAVRKMLLKSMTRKHKIFTCRN